MIRRRDFITLLGAAAAWPIATRAQQLRRLGVLMNRVKTDLLAQIAARGRCSDCLEMEWPRFKIA